MVDDLTTSGLIKCFKDKDVCLQATTTGGGGAAFYNTKLKKCWKNYPSGYYIKVVGRNEILEECEYFYHKGTGSNGDTDKYYCTNQCKVTGGIGLYFNKGQKNCEDSCKIFKKWYYDSTNNECLDTCIGRTGKEFANQITDFSDSTGQPTECITECSTNQFYNYGSKICLSACDPDKYQKSTTDNICYDSCAQIPGGKYIYESETGNQCYLKSEKNTENCAIYYPQNDGTFKCITSVTSTPSTCKTNGFDYMLNGECKKNCDNYYKLMDESSAYTKECFETLRGVKSSTKNIKYYDNTLKQCWINYPTNMYIKDEDESLRFEVVEDCDKFYYEVIDNTDPANPITYKYCTDDCNRKNLNLYFYQGNKKCESSCTTLSKNYYDPTNNECLETCIGRTLEYSLPITTTAPQPCLLKCSSSQYFMKIKDDSDSSKILSYDCIDSCASPNYIDVKTKECLDACSSTEHITNGNYCYPKCESPTNYINTDTYECVFTCPSELKKLVELRTSGVFLCKSQCETPLEYRLGDKCLDKCPQTHNYIGYNNICKSKCAEDANGEHYFPINDDGSTAAEDLIYKCVDSCSEATIPDSTTNYFYYKESDPNK